MAEVHAGESITIPQNEVGFTRSKGQKRAKFAKVNPSAKVIQVERGQR